jgi:hypothetical protein
MKSCCKRDPKEAFYAAQPNFYALSIGSEGAAETQVQFGSHTRAS